MLFTFYRLLETELAVEDLEDGEWTAPTKKEVFIKFYFILCCG